MDDLIIPSKDLAEGKERLKWVLKRASEYGLNISWKKCQIFKPSVNYLGCVIGGGTVRPSSEKTRAVGDFPEPKKVKSVQGFLGLTGFFRKFIHNYACIARPLSNLTKKDVKFKFEDGERCAFNTLKNDMCTEPVLALYCPFAETKLHTDASALGLGDILLQRDNEDRHFHPVHYASWKTTRQKEQYDSYTREVLAVVKAVKKFRHYLIGLQFKIVTDCQAFTLTMKKKDIAPQIARWALNLEDYKYTIEHRSGSKMGHVDALSHFALPEVLQIEEDEETVVARVKRNQEQDEDLAALKTKVIEGQENGFSVRNGLLYKERQDGHLLVVPRQMQDDVIHGCHEQGHFGVAKTQQLVSRDYWF